jgi:hypothetical protein
MLNSYCWITTTGELASVAVEELCGKFPIEELQFLDRLENTVVTVEKLHTVGTLFSWHIRITFRAPWKKKLLRNYRRIIRFFWRMWKLPLKITIDNYTKKIEMYMSINQCEMITAKIYCKVISFENEDLHRQSNNK